jgi:hypothetical protein
MKAELLTLLAAGALIFTLVSGSQAILITTGGDFGAGTGWIHFEQDVEFTVTAVPTLAVPFFVIDGALAAGSEAFLDITGAGLTYSVNGGASQEIHTYRAGGYTGNDVTADDSYFYGITNAPFAISDVITFHTAGTTFLPTITSASDVPITGDYDMFMTQNDGFKIAEGIAVPEPGSLTLVALCTGGICFVRRRFAV